MRHLFCPVHNICWSLSPSPLILLLCLMPSCPHLTYNISQNADCAWLNPFLSAATVSATHVKALFGPKLEIQSTHPCISKNSAEVCSIANNAASKPHSSNSNLSKTTDDTVTWSSFKVPKMSIKFLQNQVFLSQKLQFLYKSPFNFLTILWSHNSV